MLSPSWKTLTVRCAIQHQLCFLSQDRPSRFPDQMDAVPCPFLPKPIAGVARLIRDWASTCKGGCPELKARLSPPCRQR